MTNAHIARKQSLGIGKETTAGTQVSALYWLPKSKGVLKPVIETIEDDSGYGVIDELYDAQPVQEHSMIELEGTVSEKSFGMILAACFGTTAVSGSGPYTHSFTRKNDNNHPSYSIWWYDPIATDIALYSMLDSLTVSAQVGQYVKYTASFKGKKITTDSAPTPSYEDESLFRARDVKVYIEDSEGALTGATAIGCTRVSITFNKNLYIHQTTGSVDIDSIFNQQFTVRGDLELLFADTTYLALVQAGTKKYMKIELINTSESLSPSGNPTISFTLSKVAFTAWDKTDNNNEIVKQTFGFIGTFRDSDGYTAKASMINEVSSAY